MEPWYKIATPRKEVREGRSFNPDEFAIHLEQVIAGTAPEDYRESGPFFARTFFTRALREHAGMALRRLAGETSNTAPVMTLITQFGGGKTHTLTALYHLATEGEAAGEHPGVADLIRDAGLSKVPEARVAAFVGNAWDPQEGRETPWIDLARQLAGDAGVRELGPAAQTIPPGTEALGRVFKAAGGSVLILFDEVLNFLNRHRGMADQFHSFIQNLTVAVTGTTNCAAVISLPRSQVEMTDWDMRWQEKITKVVRRVAKDLIANDETEISEVVRRRLFDDLGSERIRKNISKAYSEWCFERRAQLPYEWTAVDSAATETRAKEFLQGRFEACFPFHPAVISVFQRKWQALSQYQQTRGTLAMLAQWISWAYRTGFSEARREPLITLGSAPLQVPEFRSVVLGQLGESRLVAAIDSDIAGDHSHARALDADTSGPLRNIYRRVGTAIFFESSGGQVDRVAHLPELRFALGEPQVDTASVDNAAFALENKSYFFRRVGTDGFRISYQPTLKKVVNDRRASLDKETEIIPVMRTLVKKEFERGANVSLVWFPTDSAAVQDTPRLTLVVVDPVSEWTGNGPIREQIAEWTRRRGNSDRLYPAALVWCLKKPGRELQEKVELWLAWRAVQKEIAEGTIGGEFDRADLSDIQGNVATAGAAAEDEVWGGYRYAVVLDRNKDDWLKVIDLGAGHSSSGETLGGRVITALKSEGLLSASVGAGYIERNWPPALKDSGAWPLASLRKSFLDGSLTRLHDPDATLRQKIVEFVARGDFGLASGRKPDGTYGRIWFAEQVGPEEVSFEHQVFLLSKDKASALKASPEPGGETILPPEPGPSPPIGPELIPDPPVEPAPLGAKRTFHISGEVPPEVWNRIGIKVIPKLRSGSDLQVNVSFTVTVDDQNAHNFQAELRQILADLNLSEKIKIE
jgi:hypothetical protein